MPFLRLVKEIIQHDHGDHSIQVGAVLALCEATKAYIIRLLEDTNLCTIDAKMCNNITLRHEVSKKNLRGECKVNKSVSLYYLKILIEATNMSHDVIVIL